MAATSSPSSDVSSQSPTRRFLMLLDFDCTIVNEDSNDAVVEALLGRPLPDALASLRERNFFEYMQAALARAGDAAASEDSIRAAVEAVPPTPGLPYLFRYLDGRRDDFELLVVSDANVYFIERWLEHHGVRHLFRRVFSNPASFGADGRLALRPHQAPSGHGCERCPPNMCKRAILRKYLSERQESGKAPFRRLFYVGDGANDICPSGALGPDDTAFPRKDFTMHRLLLAQGAEGFRANVVPWERGEDVVECLKKITET